MSRTLLSILFLGLSLSLFSNTPAQTVFTADKSYITSGEVDFLSTREDVVLTLLKYNDYDKWFLRGMNGEDKESKGLIAYFTDIQFDSAQNLFLVTFDINLIWPFGSKGNLMKFEVEQKFDKGGELESLLLIPRLKVTLIQRASLILHITGEDSTSISYKANVQLTPFLNFFFTLKSYRNNFEWYIDKVAGNLAAYINK